ncbi:lanthionine synthetase LanC family protein [Polyangium sp. y55x31]|uniref:lanthionine synthetase LanC family protein n=1 Tax=Polyangium sp. y55x31 TaxID=3042688 RepID=UPI00248328AE|nr:lanthionine synthetase LanC family protein [Polyangium sp. y55x31]MDI1478823.1 lanthionine synthetase LanC family protein [Polyangium sp. y55x31]
MLTPTEFLAARTSGNLRALLDGFFARIEGSRVLHDGSSRGPFDPMYEVHAAAFARATLPPDLQTPGSLASVRTSLLRLFRLTCDRILLHRLRLAEGRGLLAGESAQARRRRFLEQVLEKRLLAPMLAVHPVAAASLVGGMVRMGASVRSCVAALPVLRKTPADVRLLEFLEDDGHSWHAQHVKITFDDGACWVLKHRSSACDRVVLESMSELVPDFPVTATDMLVDVDVDTHFIRFLHDEDGFAPPDPRSLGALLALCQLLGISDLHKDNLLRVAGKLVPIDCEVMMTPRFDERFACHSTRNPSIDESMLLPFGSQQRRVLAGMLRGAGIVAPDFRKTVWKEGPDELPVLVVEESPVPAPVRVSAAWLRSVEAEYERAARRLWADRARVRDRIAAGLHGSRIRVVLRVTSSYGKLLDYAWSGGATSAAYLHGKLQKNTPHFPRRVLNAEVHALRLGLFPAFYQRFEGSHLEDAFGTPVVAVIAPASRLDACVTGLEEAAIPRNVLLLRDSIAAMFLTGDRAFAEERGEALAPGDAVAWISGILGGIEENDGVPRAHAVQERPDGAWLVDGAGADLYEGSSGLMYALAQGPVDRRNRAWGGLRKLARVSLRALAAGETGPYLMGSGRGLFSGPIGVALVCAAQDNKALKELAAALADAVCGSADGLEMGDLIDGLMGVGLALVTLKEMQIPLPRSASRVLGKIVESLSCDDLDAMLRGRKFVGVAHGVAGDLLVGHRVATTLGASAVAGKMQTLAEDLSAAILHDASFLQAHAGRHGSNLLPTGWCHGISGVLGAVAVLGHGHGRLAKLVDEIAARCGPEDLRRDNASLCHGMLGELLDFSIAADRTQGKSVEAMRAWIEHEVRAGAPVRAGSLPGATPVGYMTGLAGIQDVLRAMGTRNGWRTTLLAKLYGSASW